MEYEAEILKSIHKSFIDFTQRAERNSDQVLVDTFVDSAPLFDILSNTNNQIIFGRRGTGKTHALKYLADKVKARNEASIYIDLRSIGSNTSIYVDGKRALSERASYLINDVLQEILANLYPLAVAALESIADPNQVTIRLDDFQNAISSVKIVGQVEVGSERAAVEQKSLDFSASASVLKSGPTFDLGANKQTNLTNTTIEKKSEAGLEILHVDFSSIQGALSGLIEVLGFQRVWLLIDEWSEVPAELQPYLADLIRRTILPVPRVVVKIAAIEHRSEFMKRVSNREYIGFELAADITAALNLDDFLVFEADETKAVLIFKNLIFRHYRASEFAHAAVVDSDHLIKFAFTQQNVFAEFVRAIEGVPRDALNLAGTIAQKAFQKQITMVHVRQSARDWFQLDKAAAIRASEKLQSVLNTIVDEVIDHRKARAFLFPSNQRNVYIESLFDARILHLWKKNISSKDQPGKRYDVFKIDYGTYVDLINTANETKGLFQASSDDEDMNQDSFVDVPRDDYRSIRRAILEPEMLDKLVS